MGNSNAILREQTLSAQDQSGGVYVGTDILEAMKAAINYNRSLLALVKKYFPGDARLIDFGAGLGTFSEEVRSSGYQVACAEIDPSMQERLRKLGFQTEHSLSAFDAREIDGIFSFNTLEHIRDDKAIFAEMSEFLKSGDAILIYVPAFEELYSSMDKKVGHYRRYTRKDLESKVKAAGFIVEDSGYADSLGYFASLAYKWFGKRDGSIGVKSLYTYDHYVFPLSLGLDRVFKNLFGKNTFVFARKV